MSKKTIVYNSFRAGEWGSLGGETAPAGSFHGKNVIVYADGFIGPRPGLRNITPENMPDGELLGLGITPVPGRDGIFFIGDDAYRFNLFDPSGDTPSIVGTVTNTAGEIVYPEIDTTVNIVTTVDGAFAVDTGNDLVNDYTTSPPGHAHEIYGAQLVLAENTSSPRIFASAIGDFEDWSDGFFLDIGDNWQVAALLNQRNYLTVFKRTGIYVISGELTNDSTSLNVRRLVGAEGVLHPWWVATDSQDTAWFLQLFSAFPSSFSGATLTNFAHLQFDHREEDGTAALPLVKRSVCVLKGQLTADTPVFIQGGTSQAMFIRHNGVWSYHEFEETISAMARAAENNLVITDGGGASDPAQIYSTRFDIDRPAFVSDGLYGPGDNSNTPLEAEFELPYFFNRESAVRVRSVKIEVKKWDTGVTTNRIECLVTTLNRPNGAGDVENDLSTWTELGSAVATPGAHDRIVFPKHCPKGQGFKIKLQNLIGVAIKSVTVEYEEDLEQPRDSNG